MTANTHTPARMHGFLLLEALLAVVIISFGLLAIAGLFTKLMSGTGISKARSEAVALAEQKQEELRNTVLYGAAGTAGTFAGNAGTGSDSITINNIKLIGNANFSRSWNVCSRAVASTTAACGTANALPINSHGSLVSVS